MIKQRDDARAAAANLRSRVIHLEQALSEKGIKKEIDEAPETFENMQEWAAKHLSGSVVILNRAYRAAKKSRFENPKLVYQALFILRDQYVPMRREGGRDKKEAYASALAHLGLENRQASAARGPVNREMNTFRVQRAEKGIGASSQGEQHERRAPRIPALFFLGRRNPASCGRMVSIALVDAIS